MQPPKRDELRVNHRIRIPEIRVIGADGSQLGIMETRDAQALAEENDLDLVEVAPTARPPVCRIMDYGKYKFEQAKKNREAKAKQHRVKVKEVKMKLKISTHDYDFKIRHAMQFLEEGNKVKFRIIFRGRELSRPERGRDLADSILDSLKEHAVVDAPAAKAGREMVMVVSPTPGLREKVKARQAAKAEAAKAEAEQAEAAQAEAKSADDSTAVRKPSGGAGRPRSIMEAGLDRARRRREAQVGEPEAEPDSEPEEKTEFEPAAEGEVATAADAATQVAEESA